MRRKGGLAGTPEQRREWGRKGGLKLVMSTTVEQHQERSRKTPEQHRKWALQRWQGHVRKPKRSVIRGFLQSAICPHCGLSSHIAILKRWHFNNCPKAVL